MTLAFDAETLAPCERSEALNAAIARTDIPQEISLLTASWARTASSSTSWGQACS